jgi:hypothetical protein
MNKRNSVISLILYSLVIFTLFFFLLYLDKRPWKISTEETSIQPRLIFDSFFITKGKEQKEIFIGVEGEILFFPEYSDKNFDGYQECRTYISTNILQAFDLPDNVVVPDEVWKRAHSKVEDYLIMLYKETYPYRDPELYSVYPWVPIPDPTE